MYKTKLTRRTIKKATFVFLAFCLTFNTGCIFDPDKLADLFVFALKITNAYKDFAGNTKYEANVEIGNGTDDEAEAVDAIDVELGLFKKEADGQYVEYAKQTGSIMALSSGDKKQMPLEITRRKGDNNDYKIQVRVDRNNRVEESNEANNMKTVELFFPGTIRFGRASAGYGSSGVIRLTTSER